ncbi:hypothetical protein GIB67_009580 [Kingdonia uniflora]|uniref:Elongator complex protein 3 n=1 Tax=Kingdonia uniflora TaxID=39325 RepID=A0A7J7LXB8_9MAGN|nr:hypothetical protein GIB67_009580 [Kingdonia uniflora]
MLCLPSQAPIQDTGGDALRVLGACVIEFKLQQRSNLFLSNGDDHERQRTKKATSPRYNPYVQARGRIDQLKRLGHSVDKVEFILMGGTFMSLPSEYRDFFTRNLHDALSGHTSANIEEAVSYSEHSAVKCIGMTIETRPDYCLGPHLRQMLSYGCTRLEIGVQSTYEDVARDTNRGHTVAAVADCFCLAKDAGFKDIHHKIKPEEVELVRRDYTANEGWETFLSYEDTRQDILVGLLRLRKCGRNTTCPELTGRCSIVRELHVYGTAVPVHGRDAGKQQHQGYGTLLMEEAERIAGRDHRSTKIAVISGVGTRHYYRKLGYELEGPYMVKYIM